MINNNLINTNNLISSDIGYLTLNEITKHATSVIYENNKLNIIKDNDENRILIEIIKYPNGQEKTFAVYNKPHLKSEYESTVKQMIGDGFTQNDIANRLGISQSYVSNLLNR